MTPVFCCGFECGQLGTVGQHWENALGTASISTTIKRTGNRSLRINASTQQTGSSAIVVLSSNIIVARCYVYFASIPTQNIALLTFTAGFSLNGAYFNSADNKIYARAGAGGNGATGYSVEAGRWYMIDIKFNSSANPWTVDVMVDGNALGQATRATAAANSTSITIADSSGSSIICDINFDDIVIAAGVAADYPIGNGSVQTFVPTSDGIHNIAGTGDFQRTLTGTDILNATTTAFQLVDDVPLESGAGVDWINMVAPPNATDYVQVKFGPASGVPVPTYGPRAVEVIAGIHQAGTGNGNMEIRLNDNNNTTGIIYTATGIAGVTNIAYKRKHFATPPTGGAWNAASSGNGAFNNLKIDFGSPTAGAVDANPDQYLDCIMIEAEFAEWPQKIYQKNQAVNRIATY